MRNYVVIAALLFAAPLAAQLPETITIEPAQVTVENYLDSIALTVEWPGPDDAQVAREEAAVAAMERIAAILEECGCVDQGSTSTVVRVGQGALVLAAFFIGFQLKGIKDNTAGKHDPVSDDSSSDDTSSNDYPESEG